MASAGEAGGDGRPRLLFVSTRFLFPVDSGGKIRTTQILRGMRGGAFHVTLASPAPAGAERDYAAELDGVCDAFVSWPQTERGPLFKLTRLRHLAGRLPVAVATDVDQQGRRAVAGTLAQGMDALVVDFPHADVLLAPDTRGRTPAVLFTHNVEAEIFRRHVDVAERPWERVIWRDQHRKMVTFERDVLLRYDSVVAVSARDARQFVERYGVPRVETIDTGVDLDFFAYQPPSATGATVVFTGSMDWMANADGIEFFLDEVWPTVQERVPAAKMRVIGRSPPTELVRKAARRFPHSWTFTGFVDDVRPHAAGAAAFVIPLRVGGGTRLKAYEAMAMGCPVISTSIGVEGLALTDGEHYLQADDASAFADALVHVLTDRARRRELAQAARALVEDHCSYRRAAGQFERICLATIGRDAAPAVRHA